MPERIDAFIFDLDGVIVDTAKYHFESWKQLAEKLNIEIPDELNERLKGLGRMESLEIVLEYSEKTYSEDEKRQLAHDKNIMYLDNISHIAPGDTLPGVVQFIQDARSRGIRIGLGSGSKNAKAVIDTLQIGDLFDGMCDGNDITRSKPDPEIFACACKALNVEPKYAVVFEDAVSGIEAARNCGTSTVGVGDPETLKDANMVIPGFQGVKVSTILEGLS